MAFLKNNRDEVEQHLEEIESLAVISLRVLFDILLWCITSL